MLHTAIIPATETPNPGNQKVKNLKIASRYLSSISKGCNALELNLILEDNLMLPNGDKNKFDFNVPTYIDSALKWLFQ